jgi:hypothetical protein
MGGPANYYHHYFRVGRLHHYHHLEVRGSHHYLGMGGLYHDHDLEVCGSHDYFRLGRLYDHYFEVRQADHHLCLGRQLMERGKFEFIPAAVSCFSQRLRALIVLVLIPNVISDPDQDHYGGDNVQVG